MTATTTPGGDTRARMIDVAERLVAEVGVDALSLRTVGAQAGQRNHSAAQYHFGSKEGLVEAVIAARSPQVERRRQELLDQLLAEDRAPDVPDLLRLLIAPLAETVDAGKGWYARFLANVVAHPVVARTAEPSATDLPALRHVSRELRALLPGLPAATFRRRLQWAALMAFRVLAEHERLIAEDPAKAPPTGQVVDELVGAMAALLRSPVRAAG